MNKNNFAVFFNLEWKRFLCKRNIVILIILWGFLATFTLLAIKDYRDIENRKKDFQAIEALNFEHYPNYDIYGDSGLAVQFCPGPMGIFIKNLGVSSQLVGKLDSIVNLSIFDNYKSKSLFNNLFNGIFSFSGILFFFGSLLCLAWGAEFLTYREYQKFLASRSTSARVFFYPVLSRLLLLTLTLLCTFTAMLLLLPLNAVPLASLDFVNLGYYFVITLGLLSAFFFGGVIASILSPKVNKFLLIMTIWLAFSFLFPGLLQSLVENKTFGSIEDYRAEIKKFSITNNFEKDCFEKSGKFTIDKSEVFKEFAENYWAKYFPRIEAIEDHLFSRLESNVKTFGFLSLFTPSTFYYNTSIEIGSRGYLGFMNFYAYLRQLKRSFVRFYIDRFYYHDPKVMVNFVKDKENLFLARSHLPAYPVAGLLITLFYVTGLALLSYGLFKRSLYRVNKKELEDFAAHKLEFKKGETKVIKTWEKNTSDILYSLFSGKVQGKIPTGSPLYVRLDGKDLTAPTSCIEFLYIPSHSALPPDIRVKDFAHFITRWLKITGDKRKTFLREPAICSAGKKKFGSLDSKEKAEILLALAVIVDSSFYYFFDIAVNLCEKFAIPFTDKIAVLNSERNAVVLYLTTNTNVDRSETDKKPGTMLVEQDQLWIDMVNSYRN